MVGDKSVILWDHPDAGKVFLEVWLKPVECNAGMVTIQDYTSERAKGNETDEKRELFFETEKWLATEH